MNTYISILVKTYLIIIKPHFRTQVGLGLLGLGLLGLGLLGLGLLGLGWLGVG
jgi:hypothetical protein